MQIFVIDYAPISTAMILDCQRLNKQVLECEWIIQSTEGSRVRNHPVYKMYKEHMQWVIYYRNCMRDYRDGDIKMAEKWSGLAEKITPGFFCKEFFDNMKGRLYAKDNKHYKQFKKTGERFWNWYYVDGMWWIYADGKRLPDEEQTVNEKLLQK